MARIMIITRAVLDTPRMVRIVFITPVNMDVTFHAMLADWIRIKKSFIAIRAVKICMQLIILARNHAMIAKFWSRRSRKCHVIHVPRWKRFHVILVPRLSRF